MEFYRNAEDKTTAGASHTLPKELILVSHRKDDCWQISMLEPFVESQ